MGEITCDRCGFSFPDSAIQYNETDDRYYCPDCLGKLEADGELAYENLLESLQEDDIKEITNE